MKGTEAMRDWLEKSHKETREWSLEKDRKAWDRIHETSMKLFDAYYK